MTYEVQQQTLCDGWINNWGELFMTYAEAKTALEAFFAEIADEITTGERPVDNGYDRDEFRIITTVEPQAPIAFAGHLRTILNYMHGSESQHYDDMDPDHIDHIYTHVLAIEEHLTAEALTVLKGGG